MPNDERLVAGVELGGTKTITLIARGHKIIAEERIPTKNPAETLQAVAAQIDTWRGQYGPPEALGIASFGPLGLDLARSDYGRITSTPKIGWKNADLVGYFNRRLRLPIALDTDVAGAALAEYRWGAARGCNVVIYLTVGTGVGAGVLVEGIPLHGAVHPEFGHVRLHRQKDDGFAGTCPYHGDCLEGLVSGPAIAARAKRPASELADTDHLWSFVLNDLAEAMVALMVSFSPQRIVIGGGVFQDRKSLFRNIRERTAELLNGYIAGVGHQELSTIIVPPALGAQAGPLGAIALACQALA